MRNAGRRYPGCRYRATILLSCAPGKGRPRGGRGAGIGGREVPNPRTRSTGSHPDFGY